MSQQVKCIWLLHIIDYTRTLSKHSDKMPRDGQVCFFTQGVFFLLDPSLLCKINCAAHQWQKQFSMPVTHHTITCRTIHSKTTFCSKVYFHVPLSIFAFWQKFNGLMAHANINMSNTKISFCYTVFLQDLIPPLVDIV